MLCWIARIRCSFPGDFKLDLRKDQAKRGRRVADVLGHLPPVLRLRGELVAGDDGPL